MLSASLFATLLVAGTSSAQGTCQPGFLNTVFNTGTPKHASWPDPIWSTLTSYGIQNFITFSLLPLPQNPLFDPSPNTPALSNPTLEKARIPIVMDPRDTPTAQTLLASNTTPPYLELFNEPDYSYADATPLTDPTTAAQNLSPLLSAPHPQTTFLSPALANPNDPDWLPTFFAQCPTCLAQIDIIAMHIYEPNIDYAIGNITALHDRWNKPIWITEFGPYNGGGSGCTFDQAGVAAYASEIVPMIDRLGFVEKIFWNCGDAEAADVCNPSLTEEDGSANGVLRALGGACGFGEGANFTVRGRGG
ncbi:MAG: hypothetical protein Q9195_005245 [Heterodermia aff. obscurata]